jgi:hypothetical protein
VIKNGSVIKSDKINLLSKPKEIKEEEPKIVLHSHLSPPKKAAEKGEVPGFMGGKKPRKSMENLKIPKSRPDTGPPVYMYIYMYLYVFILDVYFRCIYIYHRNIFSSINLSAIY